ncbi:MAG: hypothetical protein R2708_22860 [Vicinamibacterales bacterium]
MGARLQQLLVPRVEPAGAQADLEEDVVGGRRPGRPDAPASGRALAPARLGPHGPQPVGPERLGETRLEDRLEPHVRRAGDQVRRQAPDQRV